MKKIISLLLISLFIYIPSSIYAQELDEAALSKEYGAKCGAEMYGLYIQIQNNKGWNEEKEIEYVNTNMSKECQTIVLKALEEYAIGARNAKRLSDIRSISTLIEVNKINTGEYPNRIPYPRGNNSSFKDPQFKNKIASRECRLGYIYEIYSIWGVKNQWYKLSSCMEESDESKLLVKNDGGTDPNRYEKGNWTGKDSKRTKRIFLNR